MRYVTCFLVVITFTFIKSEAQQNMVWHVGACSYLDFRNNNLSVVISQDTIDSSLNSNTSICHNDSSLSFFTHGERIFRADGTIMPNGDSLSTSHYALSTFPNGIPFTQGCIVINKPGSQNLIYVFHETIDDDSLQPLVRKIYRTTIDISADSGRGIVAERSALFYSSADTLMYGRLQAVRHGNGRDWWLISRYSLKNELLEWLITQDSTLGPFVIPYAGTTLYDGWLSNAAVSQNGKFYALLFDSKVLDLFSFDRCSGTLNLLLSETLHDSVGVGGGVAFSPNDSLLYATTRSFCYQLNLFDSNIWASRKIVGFFDGLNINGVPYDFNQIALAPNGKIYIAPLSTNNLWSVINHPNLLDTAANLVQHALQLGCYNNVAMPNIPNFNLPAIPGCDTLNRVDDYTNAVFSLYPNPFKENIVIKSEGQYESYQIFSMEGQLITKGSVNLDNVIHAGELNAGMYILQLKKDRKLYYRKIIKISERSH